MMNKADPTSSKGVPSSDVRCGYGGDVNLRNFRGNLLQGGEGEGRRIVGGRRKEAGQSHTRIKALPPFVLSPSSASLLPLPPLLLPPPLFLRPPCSERKIQERQTELSVSSGSNASLLSPNYLAYHKQKFSALACQMMWTVAQADQICGVHLQSHLKDIIQS